MCGMDTGNKTSGSNSMHIVERVGSIPTEKFEHICKVYKKSTGCSCPYGGFSNHLQDFMADSSNHSTHRLCKQGRMDGELPYPAGQRFSGGTWRRGGRERNPRHDGMCLVPGTRSSIAPMSPPMRLGRQHWCFPSRPPSGTILHWLALFGKLALHLCYRSTNLQPPIGFAKAWAKEGSGPRDGRNRCSRWSAAISPLWWNYLNTRRGGT